MPEIKTYGIGVYGGPNGGGSTRAFIRLEGADKKVIGFLQFKDPEMNIENDSFENGIIQMHLPSFMFHGSLDMIRNEKPFYIYWKWNRGNLANYDEPVGEGES